MTVNKPLKGDVRRKIAGVTLAEKLVRILGSEILTDRSSKNAKSGTKKESKRMKCVGTVTKVGVTLSRSATGMSRKELRNSVYWRSRLKPQSGEGFRAKVLRTREKEHEITLSTIEPNDEKRVRYDFWKEEFELVPREDLILDLLTLPSRSIRKDELLKSREVECKDAESDPLWLRVKKMLLDTPERSGALDRCPGANESLILNEELMDLYGDRLTKDLLDEYQKRYNPFNFSERVSQTAWRRSKTTWTQTEPPPSNTFSASVSSSVIYDAYLTDSEKGQEKVESAKAEKEEQQVEKKGKGKNKAAQVSFSKTLVTVLEKKEEKKKRRTFRQEVTAKAKGQGGLVTSAIAVPDLSNLLTAAKVMERMSCQMLGDEICQDYKYWDDDSDEYRPLEGSLLPLWKFWCKNSRHYTVMDLCWHPVHADLIAVAYSADLSKPVASEGMVCLFSIKNSRVPEKKFMTDSGVTCVHFHPTGEDFLAAGTKDGSVLVFRLQKKAGSAASSTASPISGKHLLAVTQVKWIQTDVGIGPSFFSIAQDGRVCLWSVSGAGLSHINVLEFPLNGQAREVDVLDDKLRRGTPTSIAVNPADSDRFLLGLDTGLVVGHSRSATTHAIASYRAHVGSVASIAWNRFYREVFGTAAADWTVKIWLVGCFTPIIIVDLGSPVGGLAWASSSSTAFVAVTDDGRAHVFDISFCKTKALCTQRLRLRQGREAALSCVAFSPFEPVILVAGERGFILSLKLSPNLRKQQKEAKGADAEKLKELERKKMERIIATSGIWQL